MKSNLDFPIRIRKIELKNFKNVQNGSIVFLKGKNKENCENVIGLYGANGSGKTTFVNALDILKSYLADEVLILPKINRETDFMDYFSIPYNTAEIITNFNIFIEDENIDVKYKLEFSVDSKNKKYGIKSEKLNFEYKSNKYELIFEGKNYKLNKNKKPILKNLYNNLKIFVESNEKQLYLHSAFFNDYFIRLLENYNEKILHDVVWRLKIFAKFNMFVITNKQFGFVNLQMNIPLNFRYSKNREILQDNVRIHEEELISGRQSLDLRKPQQITISFYEKLELILEDINAILRRLIPNTIIEIISNDCIMDETGENGKLIELVTNRDGIKIPLRNESTGILKLISIIQTLIAYCTYDDIFVAIDEFDAGIFEYLLGDLLELLAEEGRGQLFFTSHNLRPLEVLNKNCIYFSTTNQNNRYIKFVNVKNNNNLRDFYFRVIALGGQKEKVYNDHDMPGLRILLRNLYYNE